MRAGGFEPPRSSEQWHLKPSCLPFHHARNAPIVSNPPQRTCRTSGLAWRQVRRKGQVMRSAEEFDAAQRLIAAGVNDCAIARQLGIPRTTVRDWRCRPQVRPRPDSGTPCGVVHDFSTLPVAAYCYVLAMYLGDGSISRARRVWRIRITLDQKYPAIIERCCQAIEMLLPGQRAGIVKRVGCFDVSLFSKHWPCLLPQHGPGVKHNRRIALEPWQQALVDQATEEFVL